MPRRNAHNEKAMFTCEQCKQEKPDEQRMYGYEKTICSVECFRDAGKTYKPNMQTNRGGGGWNKTVSI